MRLSHRQQVLLEAMYIEGPRRWFRLRELRAMVPSLHVTTLNTLIERKLVKHREFDICDADGEVPWRVKDKDVAAAIRAYGWPVHEYKLTDDGRLFA